MTAKRWRSAGLGFVLGFVLAAAVPSNAAWLASTTTQRAAARFGTWASCSAGSATVTAVADGAISASDVGSFTITTFQVKTGSTTGTRFRGFVRWNLPTIPTGCAFTSATMTLWDASGTFAANNSETVTRVAATWTESSKPSYSQAVAGPAVAYPRCTPMPCARSVNINDIASAWYTGGASNFGVMVTWTNPADSSGLQDTFQAREGTPDTQDPTLVVSWA